MTYTCKVTVLDKKLYPELQEHYCADPQSGKCPCFNVGDKFIFERNDQKDDFWHCGAGTLVKSGKEESQSATPTGTVHCGSEDRKSTRLNSSHQIISYAVFCLKK